MFTTALHYLPVVVGIGAGLWYPVRFLRTAGRTRDPGHDVDRVALVDAFLASVVALLFAWLWSQGGRLESLVLVISADNFAGSFCGTALIAYMSGLTAAGFSATQYALLSSLYALPGKAIGGISGFVVAAYGYPAFFIMTSVIAVPVFGLLVYVAQNPEGGLRAPEPETK